MDVALPENNPVELPPNAGLPMARRFQRAAQAVKAGEEASLRDFLALYDADIDFADPLVQVRGYGDWATLNRRLVLAARELRWSVGDIAGDHDHFFAAWTFRFAPRLAPAMTIEGVTHARVRGQKIVWQRDRWDIWTSALANVPGALRLYRTITSRFA